MRHLQVFTLLLARPAIFVWGAIAVAATALTVAGLSGPDFAEVADVSSALLACFGFPFVAGLLSGIALREFQHSSFVWALPGARWKSAVGFLVCALALSAVVVGVLMSRGSAHNPAPLVAMGLASFCLGAMFVHPVSKWTAWPTILLSLAIIVESDSIGRFCDAQPLVASVGLLALVAGLVWHLFSASSFRDMPFRPTAPLLGASSLATSQRYERQKLAGKARNRRAPQAMRSAGDPWPWTRAALYENYGGEGWTAVIRVSSRLALLFLLIALGTFLDHAQELPEALGKSIYDALFRSPHLPPYGESPPYPAVALWVAAIGSGLVLFAPLALRSSLLYPLSRRDLARVAYRASLLESAAFTVLIGTILFVVGYIAGWLVGYRFRADFVPFFVRPLLATLILQPFAQYFGRMALTSNLKRQSHALAALVVGIVVFVATVTVWTMALPRAVSMAELGVLAGLLATSQLIYRRALQSRFLQADLA